MLGPPSLLGFDFGSLGFWQLSPPPLDQIMISIPIGVSRSWTAFDRTDVVAVRVGGSCNWRKNHN